MPQKISVRPNRAAVVTGLVTTGAFLVFGVVFLIVLAREQSWIGVGFLVFWIFCVLLMGGYLLHLLRSRRGVVEIEVETAPPAPDQRPDFAVRLRQLESLRQEGLVTEDEYRTKRAEILAGKW